MEQDFRKWLKKQQADLEMVARYEEDYFTSTEVETIVEQVRRRACQALGVDPGPSECTPYAALAYVSGVLEGCRLPLTTS